MEDIDRKIQTLESIVDSLSRERTELAEQIDQLQEKIDAKKKRATEIYNSWSMLGTLADAKEELARLKTQKRLQTAVSQSPAVAWISPPDGKSGKGWFVVKVTRKRIHVYSTSAKRSRQSAYPMFSMDGSYVYRHGPLAEAIIDVLATFGTSAPTPIDYTGGVVQRRWKALTS